MVCAPTTEEELANAGDWTQPDTIISFKVKRWTNITQHNTENRLNNVEVHSATLLLGDSWASLSGNQWADGKTALESMTKAQYDYGYVWLSLGGNDFLDNKCDISMADDVSADIVNVISHLVDNAAKEDIRILFFGYSVPSSDVCGNGETAELFEEQGQINFDAIEQSDYSDYVTTS